MGLAVEPTSSKEMTMKKTRPVALAIALALISTLASAPAARADENLFGYLSGAETLPDGASELYVWVTNRSDKEVGKYSASNVELEYEYGIKPKLTGALSLIGQSIDTHGILIDGYVPGDEKYGLRYAGLEGRLKYKFLSPLIDPVGFAMQVKLENRVLDPHSGRDKDTLSLGLDALLQKNFLGDTLVTVANLGTESTYADRAPIADLPEGFDWPTDPETELEVRFGLGATYRFAANWFAGAEAFYETELETEVGQERWSVQAGPTLHYAARKWWVTATWLPQLRGGGETYPGQTSNLHLVEKTKTEVRLKIGFNF